MFLSIFSKQHPKVGARPGTLVIPKEAPVPRIRMIDYVGTTVNESDVTDPETLRDAFNEDSVTWIDIQGFGDKSLFHRVGEMFQLHPLLLEDIVNVPQRPKSEAYGEQLLIIVRMVRVDERDDIETEQVSVVLGKTYVLTFQEQYGDVLDPVRKRIRDGKGPISRQGADYLAYALVDTIIDAYYPALEEIGDRLETLEDEVLANPTPELLSRLNGMKNRLMNLRRGIWPQREAINGLLRDRYPQITEEVRLHLRDTYDHCVQTSEVTEMYREMVTGMMSIYLSSVANRTNDVMRVLTVVATIFIPLTFLAGIYGMNFENMPELKVWWAYPIIWLTMFGVAAGMLAFFWKKGWIGSQESAGDAEEPEN